MSDGLVSNVSLILGMAGGGVAGTVVRLTGLTGLLAGAVSMAIGEYVSMSAHGEFLQHELDVERRELRADPSGEQLELALLYERRGVPPERAELLAHDMMRDPDLALEAHAREELGIDPDELGSPVRAAVASFLSFAVGALVPVLPWFAGEGTAAVVASLVLALLAAVALGAAVARMSGHSVRRAAVRQVVLVGVACAVTWLLGRAIGVTV